MAFFEQYFGISDGMDGEQAVCCPFPHHTENGIEYYEHKPSAHVNLSRRLFHCKVCEAGYNERTFIKNVLDCSLTNATKLENCFKQELGIRQEFERQYAKAYDIADNFGITKEVVDELDIIRTGDGYMLFPVYIYDMVCDVRTYRPNQSPKMLSNAGAMSGLIVPFDSWRKTKKNKVTVVCAGEKDMATTKSHGFNAITLTGGEGALPAFYSEFKNRHVVICYDNDDAGRKNAKRLARVLKPICASVKVCTLFHNVCKENKEDLTDFWNKYHGTREQLIQFFEATPEYVPEDDEEVKNAIPYKTLSEYTADNTFHKVARCNIQVVATSENVYIAPTSVLCTKVKEANGTNEMYEGETREWVLTEHNLGDILHLVDNNFKEDDIKTHIKKLAKVPPGEKYIKVDNVEQQTIYKLYVSEMVETSNDEFIPMEYTCYSVGARLESGKKYEVSYVLVPHPYKGKQLTMIIVDAKPATDSITDFKINEETKQSLDTFRCIEGSVPEKMELFTEKAKGLIGYNGNNQLIQLIDLSFHTVLFFNFGNFKDIRGYLDTIIVGESRVGKSSTADALRKAYALGTFTSLAGNSATIPGLVGGSNKTGNGGMQTKAGLIPQNNKGLLIFEEFSKCNTNVIRELTDIRSSNEVRITRVSGSLKLPAFVRMITLSNTKSTNGRIKSIASYPNGISIITELVENAEDIARYDLIGILSDKGNSQIDPLWKPEPSFNTKDLRNRIRWVWSRTQDQVIITDEIVKYICDFSNLLNNNYNTHIKIFGTECWKKLTRLSIAVAGYLVSTDDTYQNIIVKKEHVDFAAEFMEKLYDNSTFKLKEYAEYEKRYSVYSQEDIQTLQELYSEYGEAITLLETNSEVSKGQLALSGGLNNDQLSAFTKTMSANLFIRMSQSSVFPTEKFRGAANHIDKKAAKVRRINEGVAFDATS